MSDRRPTWTELLTLAEGLSAENARLHAEVDRLTQRVAELEAELAQREPPPARPPPWVKPKKPPRSTAKAKRQKRARGFGRPRAAAPTQVVEHAVANCPTCGCALRGGTVKRHREIIEIVLPPVVITDHRLLERTCPQCNTTCLPTLGAREEVVGQRRFGPNLLALIATLHEEGRMPVEVIQQHLATLYRIAVSVGAIIDALHTVAVRGAAPVAAIHEEIRQSAVVNADETGWREDGENRSVWLIATPTARYFELGRRTNEQIDQILGADFSGTLVVDFYAAYDHFRGEKQRCWAHLLRDVRDLLAQYPDDRVLARWASHLGRLYRAARDSPVRTPSASLALRQRLEALTRRLCAPFLNVAVPHKTLCQRIVKYLSELYTFVTDRRVPPTNNEAERAFRPLVTGRKVSGGTRSEQGSRDAMHRATLFRTWHARRLNPFTEVRKLLLTPQV